MRSQGALRHSGWAKGSARLRRGARELPPSHSRTGGGTRPSKGKPQIPPLRLPPDRIADPPRLRQKPVDLRRPHQMRGEGLEEVPFLGCYRNGAGRPL